MVNPPTTLNAARAIAIAPRTVSGMSGKTAKTRSAPNIVTAEMAFVIDINGVCRSGGTFEISRYPIIIDRINTEIIISNSLMALVLYVVLLAHCLKCPLVYNPAITGNQRATHDLVFQVGDEITVFEKILNVIIHIGCIKPA